MTDWVAGGIFEGVRIPTFPRQARAHAGRLLLEHHDERSGSSGPLRLMPDDPGGVRSLSFYAARHAVDNVRNSNELLASAASHR